MVVMPRQVDLAVLAGDVAVLVDDDGGVVAPGDAVLDRQLSSTASSP